VLVITSRLTASEADIDKAAGINIAPWLLGRTSRTDQQVNPDTPNIHDTTTLCGDVARGRAT
jgi:hypothetical protein